MEELAITTVSRERLSDTIRDQLMRLMIDQSLRPGDELPSETKLANQFGVSKPVIREALRGLAAMGVIEIQQGKLATVRSPSSEPLENFLKFAVQGTPEGLREAIELRRTLEKDIAMLAAERVTDEEVRQLETAISKMREATGTVDPWVEADLQFHLTLAKTAKNRLMLFLVEALRGLFHESILLLHVQRPERDTNATLQRHTNIVEAVKAGDPAAAREAMKIHFDATGPDMILAVMKAQLSQKE